jgi:hypothetical protein
MLRGLVGSYGHLLSPGWSGCGEGGVRGSLRMTGVGGVVVGKSKKQRQGQIQESLHCASQRQGRDASVEMTEFGWGRARARTGDSRFVRCAQNDN